MSRSEIRRKHVADATQLRRRSHPASPTYKDGPPGRANGRAMHNAHKERYKGPPVSLLEENKDEGRQGGRPNPRFGRTCPASRPGALRGGVAAKSPDHLPHMYLAGTDLH